MADTVGGMDVAEVSDIHRQWRENHASTAEIGFRAISPGFIERNPNLANLYLQISRTNPPRPEPGPGQTAGPGSAELARMKVPTLFIVGEEDELTPPQVIEAGARQIPGAKVTRVPEAGHSVYFEKPDIFNFEVLRFLQRVEQPVQVGAAARV